MRIGIAQLNTRAGDLDATAERMEAYARSARERGVELLLFPLATLTGPQPVSYANHEGLMIDLSNTLVSLAQRLACPCIVPVVTESDGVTIAEAMLLKDKTVEPLRMMGFLERSAKNGTRRTQDADSPVDDLVFELEGLRLGLAFAYDDIDAFEQAQAELDALLFFSGYGYALDDASSAMGAALGENRYRSDAIMLDAELVGIASLGGYGTQVFTGSSFVLDYRGDLVASAPAFEEDLLVCDICLDGEADEAAGQEAEIYNRSLHLWESLSLGLRDYLAKLGKADVALVLDNSLSSCLLATLSSDALGPRHVHALLPSKDDSIARGLAESLHINSQVSRLSQFDAGAFPVADDDLLQAELAALARLRRAIPLSNMDKTHLALEANALSCSCFALLPFGDVYRSDLIGLAHLRNTISPVIPPEALGAYEVPSFEGLEQAEPNPETRLKRLDVTVATHVEWERPVTDVAARQGEEALTQAILARLREVEPARHSLSPVLSMSSRTLIEARMPLGFAWHDRLRSEDERVGGGHMLDRLGASPQEPKEPVRSVSFAKGLLGEAPANLLEGVDLPEGIDRREIESSLGELMGIVRDLLEDGGSPAERSDGANPPLDGPFGPLTWDSPFSDN